MSLRTAILLSGGGRTLEHLCGLARGGALPIEVVLAVSSDPAAYGVTRAREAGVPVITLRRRDFEDTAAYTAAVFAACRAAGAELVLLAGWLKLLCPIPEDFRGRTLNIHPALIPAFCGRGLYGDRVHRAALEHGVKLTGCTVHYVDDEYDHGPIVLQRGVAVHEDDDVRSLAGRVFAAEQLAYPEAIRLHAAGRLRIEGRRVRVLPEPSPDPAV